MEMRPPSPHLKRRQVVLEEWEAECHHQVQGALVELEVVSRQCVGSLRELAKAHHCKSQYMRHRNQGCDCHPQ